MHPANVLHPVEVRTNSTDAEAFRQVLLDEEYAAFGDLDLRTIVDCGANVGYASAFFLSHFRNARVVAIEPFASNAEQCRRNLAPYGERASVIEGAIWNCKTRLAIEDPGGGEWAIRVRQVMNGEAGDVDGIDIPSLGLLHIDLLKIDIERSEIDLFAMNVEKWMPSVSNIAIELHGPDCALAFARALKNYDCDLSRSGELTICRNIRRGSVD